MAEFESDPDLADTTGTTGAPGGADSGPPTVHPDADHPAASTASTATVTATAGGVRTTRRDPVLLVAGVVAVAVAVLAVLGPGVIAAFDPRWVLAVAALVVGVAILATTVRRRR